MMPMMTCMTVVALRFERCERTSHHKKRNKGKKTAAKLHRRNLGEYVYVCLENTGRSNHDAWKSPAATYLRRLLPPRAIA